MQQSKVPFISICVPAYKNVTFLKRLLDSIVYQSFKDYEVVISDDSPDEEVSQLLTAYQSTLPQLIYNKNLPARGMPENWNTAVSNAKGEWIKIMHDDDWFADEDSLGAFATAALTAKARFIFSNYINRELNSGKSKSVVFPGYKLKKIRKIPLLLMAGNLIGPPSVCMIHKSCRARYNPRMHWLVDIDYYIQLLLQPVEVSHIGKELICIGVNPDQVTKAVKNNPAIEIGEAKMLLDQYGQKWLKDLTVYDGWWRLFRNMHVENEAQLNKYGGAHWPLVLRRLLAHQNKVPAGLLGKGLFSKVFMLLSYLSQFSKL